MPLDYGNVTWPPASCAEVAHLYQRWGAWYSGDPDLLATVYRGAAATGDGASGGMAGALRRMWWGRRPTASQGTTRLHVPAASDISALSADLLFGERCSVKRETEDLPTAADRAPDGPALVIADPAQDRLDDMLDESGAYPALLEAAEICSAYGGVYLRVSANKAVADTPLLDAIHPDNAHPEWVSSRLQAVTFWRTCKTDDGKTWRHLERHEVLGTGPTAVGMVYHGLYVGARDRLGAQWPLDAHPDTARFALMVDEQGGIATGASLLDVVYVPNVRPNRLVRGTPLGRSDYQGVEPIMDALDETWSSWLRDIRLAKARVIVPEAYLRSGGQGQGAEFDAEQEIFQSVNILGKPDQAPTLEQVQFEIRVAEHAATTSAQWRAIMRGAGLSADAFGEEVDGGAATAKEIGKRGERTQATRGRKIGYWRPEIERIGLLFQQLDVALFGAKYTPIDCDAEWPDAAAPDPETLSRTIQLLDAAKAVSTRTKVRMVHPDWDDTKVDEEVELIDGAAMEDPGTFTGAPAVPPIPHAITGALDLNTPPATAPAPVAA